MAETNNQEAITRKVKREFYRKSIKRFQKQMEDEANFQAWTKGRLKQSLNKIEADSSKLDDVLIQIVCEDERSSGNQVKENEEMDDIIIALKIKIGDRLEVLEQKENISKKNTNIETRATNAAENILNTWGTFDGDFAMWRSFRDRWLSMMHKNKNIATTTKFSHLKAACIGSASDALGDWQLTNRNYFKAWNRLKSIYENDYMHVESLIRMINDLSPMNNSSSETLGNMINAVQKHINGLKRCIKIDDSNLYAVFTIISKMDSETYDAWEKYRCTLAKADFKANEENKAILNTFKLGKYIPKWSELEHFLRSEVKIRIQAEKRSRVGSEDQSPNSKRIKNTKEADGNTKSG